MKQAVEFLFDSNYNDIGIAIIAPDTRVIFANTKTKQLYPVEEGTMLPKNHNLSKVIDLAIKRNQSVAGFPVHETIDGKSMHVLLYIYPFSEDDNISYVFIILCDNTSLNQYNDSRYRQAKLQVIGDMAAGTANLILNPLTVIKGTLQLMERSLRDNILSIDILAHPLHEKLAYYFDTLYGHVQRIDDDLQRFLLLGKPSEDLTTPISITVFLQGVVPCIQMKAVERKIRLSIEYPHLEAWILGHELYLREVLDALLENAFEASEAGGKVILGTEITEKEIHITVTDEGQGIAPQLLPYVKDPFVTTKEDALGFGLSYSDRLVEKMGGVLRIESSAQGTSVYVTFPKIV